eukprot:TRINITY_DN21373_c0_g1_i1.p1 TRINITY_DN21373_c0_g1~~TRINITY_DN21373_c0_g1_i1.p1  ORF type:complete len:349 (+),score=29.06 TRINITY_DN21373_c0_g1_i1:154-1047(+)
MLRSLVGSEMCIRDRYFQSPTSEVELKSLVEGWEGEQPDCDNIRKYIRWLLDGAAPGDNLVFYFSGCGTVCNQDNALVPLGYGFPDRLISMAELHNTFISVAPRGSTVLLLIDACYATSLHDLASRQEGTTGSVESPALVSVKRRRGKRGIAADAPWRSMLPPPGMEKHIPQKCALGLGSLQQYGLSSPYTQFGIDGRYSKSASNAVVYEASSGTFDIPQGAWDAFDTRTGRTIGVFTRAICTVLEQEMATPRSRPLLFWEFHERVSKLMRSEMHPQSPRIVLQAPLCLDKQIKITT